MAPNLVVHRSRGSGAAQIIFEAELDMPLSGLSFPVVAKPDRGSGCKGVRLIGNEDELREYAPPTLPADFLRR